MIRQTTEITLSIADGLLNNTQMKGSFSEKS